MYYAHTLSVGTSMCSHCELARDQLNQYTLSLISLFFTSVAIHCPIGSLLPEVFHVHPNVRAVSQPVVLCCDVTLLKELFRARFKVEELYRHHYRLQTTALECPHSI